ncbi:MAG: T9SS type A sorting domain-containing protein [Flavobacteriales bacterium]
MKSILFFITLIYSFLSFSQSTVNNLDFEDRNFNGWTVINGTVLAPLGHGAHPFVFSSFGELDSGIYKRASHLVIDSQQNDSNISIIKVLCPFTNSNSARLGDLSNGAKATRLERTITVDSSITTLDLFFALVMHDPSHPIYEQPYIFIELYDSNGGALSLIDSVFIQGGDERLNAATGNWRYVDWRHQKFDLSAFVGRKVLVRITNGDCGYGAHSGRLYIDFSMDPRHVYSSVFLCSNSDSVQFRGNIYRTAGIYRDTVWSGLVVDSIFTIKVSGPITISTSAKLSYNLCANSSSFKCIVNRGAPGTINYEWIVNGVSMKVGSDFNFFYNSVPNDTIYCIVSHIASNCFTVYSDTLIRGNISQPTVDLVGSSAGLNANVTGGIPPFTYAWSYYTVPLASSNSSISTSANGTYFVSVTDANGCIARDSIIGYITSIKEIKEELEFNFYPNPATSVINIQLNGKKGVIEIIDLQGKVVQRSSVQYDSHIHIDRFTDAIYLLRFTSDNGSSVSKKLVIK